MEKKLSAMFITALLLFSFAKLSVAVDVMTQSQSIKDDESFLVSKDGSFEMGFFSPGSSKARYLGIWYKNIPVQTVVWVANRSKPINDSSGVLTVNKTTGDFLLLSHNQTVVWSTNSTAKAQSPLLQLLDSGNLVLRDEKDENPETFLWQSFDFPCDTLLPGMKLGWNRRTGLNRRLSAWKSSDDPSPGDLSWDMELREFPEPVMWNGTKEFLRSGPWNGLQFIGKPTKALPLLKFSFHSDEDEVYFTFVLANESVIGRMVLNETLFNRRALVWSDAEQNWTTYATFPRDQCDRYGYCGANSNCVLALNPVCQCLDKFKPKSLDKWRSNDWSSGCERKKALKYCQNDDGFAKYEGLKLPDTTHTWVDHNMSLKDCRGKCSSNCTCMAYANTDVRDGGRGCAIWFGDLIDIKQIPGGGQDLYVRLSASEVGANKDDKWKIGVIVASAVVIILGLILAYCCYNYISHRKNNSQDNDHESQKEDLELPLFDLSTIAAATDDFSLDNKLGEGGFGPVYRGRLNDGQDIAVKRLSACSGQGMREFRNEVTLIAKLQHRNLVKIHGCCIEGDEKLLIYEYMPNKSLDFFIFDQTLGKLLDWPKRFDIICGIARGLLYLHQDSRLRIIHRDLKASNVLLDSEMNPKISDFGMARTFWGDETQGNTRRVAGTYGYMAPEYALEGQFSVKSDVFSFGVLMLEIISGKRSKGFYHLKHNLNLIGNAWNLWREERPLELIDECLGNNCSDSEVLRCIHISLLCLQQQPEDRPTMSSVVQMLGGSGTLLEPSQPGFLEEKNSNDVYTASTTHELVSINELTITMFEAR
ncbi:G-type lectin S-receptor-like serine/threonine-protein kinase At4g27290 [Humulus lupulus]|uniref:G-type lectin S-receptor-like serine/threonine-protein kinase At4g27290 n=1 Tax=Humulus lupulus TaxID=3486 RepID=UPI002B40A45F|nr:G-type lectin S-receptor-like serine/threonine-protein kinase At4g27290 [Humulus lupulus]